ISKRDWSSDVCSSDLATRKELISIKEPLPVRSVAYSHDGKLLALGLFDKTAKIVDAATGGLLATLAGHTGGVNAVAFSPDGKMLATASLDQTVKFWDVSSRKELKTLAGHKNSVLHLVFSPDGKTL